MATERKHANFFEGSTDTGHALPGRGLRKFAGSHCTSADNHFGAVSKIDGNAVSVVTILTCGAVGLYSEMTPDGAREIAKALNEMANEVEAAIAAQASAAIERSRKGGA